MFTIEVEQEEDGRWIAEITNSNGVMAYGNTPEEAVTAALRFTHEYPSEWTRMKYPQFAPGAFKRAWKSFRKS
jgi:hypothetical protein